MTAATTRSAWRPARKWISCKGGDNVSGYLLTDELLQCAEWILAPTDLQGNNPDPAKRPHVVNNSWGGGHNDYWFTGVVDAWACGWHLPAVLPTATPVLTALQPAPRAITGNVFAAGASDINDNIAGFSSRGPSQTIGYPQAGYHCSRRCHPLQRAWLNYGTIAAPAWLPRTSLAQSPCSGRPIPS